MLRLISTLLCGLSFVPLAGCGDAHRFMGLVNPAAGYGEPAPEGPAVSEEIDRGR
jgi:hypothetical protein